MTNKQDEQSEQGAMEALYNSLRAKHIHWTRPPPERNSSQGDWNAILGDLELPGKRLTGQTIKTTLHLDKAQKRLLEQDYTEMLSALLPPATPLSKFMVDNDLEDKTRTLQLCAIFGERILSRWQAALDIPADYCNPGVANTRTTSKKGGIAWQLFYQFCVYRKNEEAGLKERTNAQSMTPAPTRPPPAVLPGRVSTLSPADAQCQPSMSSPLATSLPAQRGAKTNNHTDKPKGAAIAKTSKLKVKSEDVATAPPTIVRPINAVELHYIVIIFTRLTSQKLDIIQSRSLEVPVSDILENIPIGSLVWAPSSDRLGTILENKPFAFDARSEEMVLRERGAWDGYRVSSCDAVIASLVRQHQSNSTYIKVDIVARKEKRKSMITQVNDYDLPEPPTKRAKNDSTTSLRDTEAVSGE